MSEPALKMDFNNLRAEDCAKAVREVVRSRRRFQSSDIQNLFDELTISKPSSDLIPEPDERNIFAFYSDTHQQKATRIAQAAINLSNAGENTNKALLTALLEMAKLRSHVPIGMVEYAAKQFFLFHEPLQKVVTLKTHVRPHGDAVPISSR